jgi:uncharacterized membrane protein required for colicin V production
MNWTDLAVLGIIILFIVICYRRGFILSLLGIGSIIISFVVTLKFYPVLAAALIKTGWFTSLSASIAKNLSANPTVAAALNAQSSSTVANALQNTIPLPAFVKSQVLASVQNVNQVFSIKAIVDSVAGSIARLVITGISIILIFIAIQIVLMIVTGLVRGVTKLPVIKQVDKFLGILIGIVEGVLVVFVVIAVVVLLGSMPQFKSILDSLDKSWFAGFFYRNNIILNVIKSIF